MVLAINKCFLSSTESTHQLWAASGCLGVGGSLQVPAFLPSISQPPFPGLLVPYQDRCHVAGPGGHLLPSQAGWNPRNTQNTGLGALKFEFNV